MIESLFQGNLLKTTRERETERMEISCSASKRNGLLRYRLRDISVTMVLV